MSKNMKLNIMYALLQFFYWMGSSALLCFAVTFLKSRGFTNSISGVILSLGDIVGFFIVAFNADITDKSKTGFSFVCALCGTCFQALLFLILFSVQGEKGVLALSFVLCIALGQLVNSMGVKMLIDFLHVGQKINFGVTRSLGSISFGITALLIGLFVNKLGINIIPALGLFAVASEAVTILVLRSFFHVSSERSPENRVEENSAKSLSTIQFLSSNKRFLVLLLGLALVFAMNNSVGCYLIIIIENVGGDVSDLGKLTCYFALLECPMMIVYKIIRQKSSCVILLRVSLLFFFIKILILSVSQSIPAIYLAFSTQIFTTGLYTPVIVDYINKTFSFSNSAKAQSLAMMMATVGTIISSFLTGILFDHLPVNKVIFFYSLVSFSGLVISVIGTREKHASRS